MAILKSIAVFCGSGSGNNQLYVRTGYELGALLAKHGIRVVYGGAQVGVMGAVADGALANNGKVVGVIPGFLKTKEIAHAGLTDLIVVDSMHERKLKMHELTDGIIALPGGWGTMEELFEMLTWAQLGLHTKPVGLLNTNNYYGHLISMVDHMVQESFLTPTTRAILLADEHMDSLLHKMQDYVAPPAPQWLNNESEI
jgi:uncharacterized protein (TIGR00730 family)